VIVTTPSVIPVDSKATPSGVAVSSSHRGGDERSAKASVSPAARRWKVRVCPIQINGVQVSDWRVLAVRGSTINAARMNAARQVLDDSGHADHPAVRVLDCCQIVAGPY
jgi:hypothetical protein